MYMFDLNQRYNRPIVAPIQIKHVHSSVAYQWAIYKKYDRCGYESPSGYGSLAALHAILQYPSNRKVKPSVSL